MSNPLRRLKYLPWRSLAIIAGITLAIVLAIELLLGLTFSLLDEDTQSAVISILVSTLYSRSLSSLTVGAIGAGIGALAVFLLETIEQRISINAGVLWSLILCLLIGLIIRNYIPIPALLTRVDEMQLFGMILGVFYKGKRYWR